MAPPVKHTGRARLDGGPQGHVLAPFLNIRTSHFEGRRTVHGLDHFLFSFRETLRVKDVRVEPLVRIFPTIV